MNRAVLRCFLALVVAGTFPVAAIAEFTTGGVVGGLTRLPTAGGLTNLTRNAEFDVVNFVDPSWPDGTGWKPVTGHEGAWAYDSLTDYGCADPTTGCVRQSMKMSGRAGAQAYQVVHLTPGTYTLSGYIRTSAGGSGRARLMLDLRRWNYESTAGCTVDCGVNYWDHTQEVAAGQASWIKIQRTITISQAHVDASKPSIPGTIKAVVVLDGYWADASLTAWYDHVQLEQPERFPLDVFMQYPNYRGMVFSTQSPEMRFRVASLWIGGQYELHATVCPEATTALSCDGVAPLYTAGTSLDTSPVTVALPTTGMVDKAPYLVEFKVWNTATSSEVGPRYPAYRVVPVTTPDTATLANRMNVRFDEQNRVLLKDPRPADTLEPGETPGEVKPRFVLGVYDSGLGSVGSATNWESLLWSPTGARRMDGLKINAYLNYHLGDTDAVTINNLMDNLASHGVVYLQTGNCFSSFTAGGHNSGAGFKIDPQPPATTNPYIQAPPPDGIGAKVAGYYTADECVADTVPSVFSQYQRLVRWDADALTFGTLFGTADLPLWRDSIDVLSTDPYPLYGKEPAGGYDHYQVGRWTRLAGQAVHRSRPYFAVLQFFKFDASQQSQGRWPTYFEMRNHAYMAIVEGAKGLFWWSLGENGLLKVCGGGTWCAEREQYMDRLKQLVAELAADDDPSFQTALLSDHDGTIVTGITTSPAPTASGEPYVFIKAVPPDTSGLGYVFAYSRSNASVTATFSVPAYGDAVPQTIALRGEPGTVISQGPWTTGVQFTDDFGPYQARVYAIQYEASGTPPPPGDVTPPTVTAVTPPAGATGVARTTQVTATFSEPMNPATITTSTFELRDAGNNPLAADVSYDSAANRALLTPPAALAVGTQYTATVRGGATDPRVTDLAGNALASNVTWSFTTASASGNATQMYVWDIAFESRTRGGKNNPMHDERIVVTIRRDSNASGVAESTDQVVAGASVTVVVSGPITRVLSGTTDSTGAFRTTWLTGLTPGTYVAEVSALGHGTYAWNHALDPTANDTDTDGDGLPEQTHSIPH
jgi:hypothetical protein